MSEVPGVTSNDIVCAVAPITFDVISQEIYIPLIVGARVVFADSDTLRDGQALAELIDRKGATLTQPTPTRWRMLIDDGWQGRPGFKAQTGGEALTRGLADEILARGDELWNIYGLTETTVWSTADRILPGRDVPTIGRPLANTQVYVVNPAGLPQPVGVAGELLIGGLGVGTGYLNRPDLTAERLVPDTFRPEAKRRLYRIGDLAKWLPDGRLLHLGRMDSQV
jgi:non-ribosomal peptide synthetase component F